MKLKEKQIDAVVRKVVEVLKQKGIITFKHPEGSVIEAMKAVFIDNLRQEDTIIQETQKLLDQTRRAAGGSFDEQKMFSMIKKELCKKKNFII